MLRVKESKREKGIINKNLPKVIDIYPKLRDGKNKYTYIQTKLNDLKSKSSINYKNYMNTNFTKNTNEYLAFDNYIKNRYNSKNNSQFNLNSIKNDILSTRGGFSSKYTKNQRRVYAFVLTLFVISLTLSNLVSNVQASRFNEVSATREQVNQGHSSNFNQVSRSEDNFSESDEATLNYR